MPVLGHADPLIRPYVQLVLRGPQGTEQIIQARLDTGFDISLALPQSFIDTLGLQATTARRTQVADGSFVFFMEYRVRVLWEGFERPIRVLGKSGDALAGVALFEGYRVCIEFIDGGDVNVEFLF